MIEPPMDCPDRRPPDPPDFRLLAKIGQGGFGAVWIARHRHTGDAVAIKFIAPGSRQIELKGLQQLRQRVRAGKEHLVWPEYIGEAGDYIYCVMDLADPVVEGPLFADRYEALTLLKHYRQKGRLDVFEAAAVTLSIAQSLSHLQAAGLRHGDIKPANILRVRGKWKLIDYGLMGGLDVKARGGTGPYLPPEGPHGDRADQFALGIVLFEMVFGYRPNASLRDSWPESRLASGLRRVQQRLTEPDPSRRFPSSAELVQELESLLSTPTPAVTGVAGACPSCGEPNFEDGEVCGSCGSELSRQCPVCQHRCSILQRYCSRCRGPVQGIIALQSEIGDAEGILESGEHQSCLQRVRGPLHDLMQEVSRDLAKLLGGDLSRQRRVEAIESELVGRITRVSEKCDLLQQLEASIAAAREQADLASLHESIDRALELVPGARNFERLRAELPILDARARWASALRQFGDPQVDPATLSDESLRAAISGLRWHVPQQPLVREEAKSLLSSLRGEELSRVRRRCAAAAERHLRAQRPLQALRWLRIAQARHAADAPMLDAIARLSSELNPKVKELQDAGRDALKRPGRGRRLRRIAAELVVIEGAGSPIATRIAAEWQRRRRIGLLRRIGARSQACVARGDFMAAETLLALARRIASRDSADRVIELENSIIARIRAVRLLISRALDSEAAAKPEEALRCLEQASHIAPDWIELSVRLGQAREAVAALPIRRRRRRIALGVTVSALLLTAGIASHHVLRLAPLFTASSRLADSTGVAAAEARRQAIEVLADPRLRGAFLLTDMGLNTGLRRQWEASWERGYGLEGPLDVKVALAGADELDSWRAACGIAEENSWMVASARRLTSGVLPHASSDPIAKFGGWADSVQVMARSGGDVSITIDFIRADVEELIRADRPPARLKSLLPVMDELLLRLQVEPAARDLSELVSAAIDRWCSDATSGLRSAVEDCVGDAFRFGPSEVRALPDFDELPECGDGRIPWIRAVDRLRSELGWASIRVGVDGVAGPLHSREGDGGADLRLTPVVVGEELMLVAIKPVSEFEWCKFAKQNDCPDGPGPRLGLSIEEARDYCGLLPEVTFLGRRWRAVLPDEAMWRDAWTMRTNSPLEFDVDHDEWLDVPGVRDGSAARASDGVAWYGSDEGDSFTVVRPFFRGIESSNGVIDPAWLEGAWRPSASTTGTGSSSDESGLALAPPALDPGRPGTLHYFALNLADAGDESRTHRRAQSGRSATIRDRAAGGEILGRVAARSRSPVFECVRFRSGEVVRSGGDRRARTRVSGVRGDISRDPGPPRQ